MLRRVKNKRPEKRRPPVVFRKVGGPYAAPPPASSINLPMMNPDGSVGGSYGYRNGGDYMDRGLDDYNALHYYGLDGLDNIDF